MRTSVRVRRLLTLPGGDTASKSPNRVDRRLVYRDDAPYRDGTRDERRTPDARRARTSHARRPVAADALPAAARCRVRRGVGRSAFVGSAPFLFVLAAITLDLDLGHHLGDLAALGRPGERHRAPRNIGEVPTDAGALVPYVSPNRIEIPSIDAAAPIVRVGTLPGRELQIPLNPKVVGWWGGGAKPGARKGTAILAGHINYAGVTGELAKIGTLDPGDTVYVYGKRGDKQVRLKFLITGVRTYDKTALPYQEIFDQTQRRPAGHRHLRRLVRPVHR